MKKEKKTKERKTFAVSGKLLKELIRRSRKSIYGMDYGGYARAILWRKFKLK